MGDGAGVTESRAKGVRSARVHGRAREGGVYSTNSCNPGIVLYSFFAF